MSIKAELAGWIGMVQFFEVVNISVLNSFNDYKKTEALSCDHVFGLSMKAFVPRNEAGRKRLLLRIEKNQNQNLLKSMIKALIIIDE